MDVQPTTRAYTLRLSGSRESNWRDLLWNTHVTVNRGVQVWGDWLLTLRGGLPATLADDSAILPVTDKDVENEEKRRKTPGETTDHVREDLEQRRLSWRRIVLGLSWLSVESPASLAPAAHIVVRGVDAREQRNEAVLARFRSILARLNVADPETWLDEFCVLRSEASGAGEEYLIRKRAIDGWSQVVSEWSRVEDASPEKLVQAVRDLQSRLEQDQKFGDVQLFEALAVDEARCVWQTPDGGVDSHILQDYVTATIAEHDQRRFKVPAYRHPDPLRHPVFVDYGDSRWRIAYSGLAAVHARNKTRKKLAEAKLAETRLKLERELTTQPDLRGVTLDTWNGQRVESLSLRWSGKRLWNDLDLQHFDGADAVNTVSRADRAGRAVAGIPNGAVNVAEVFDQKGWSGRLQIPREQLNRLADLIYGKDENGRPLEPNYAILLGFQPGQLGKENRLRKEWSRLKWFLSFSANLRPMGPWLDYVQAGLPGGVEYKTGRTGLRLHYDANKNRGRRAQLQLARLPGLRVLSLDLGHRYAAACAVWETITREQMEKVCQEVDHPIPDEGALYFHLHRPTNKIQRGGARKGQPVVGTTVYRRIGPDILPDGSPHPAPWARLDRQFLIKLQGEDRPARLATQIELDDVNLFRASLGLEVQLAAPSDGNPNHAGLRIDQLQKDTVRIARLGLRRLADCARIAHAFTAREKPVSGGRTVPLDHQQRIDYVLDALVRWQTLAQSTEYRDDWAIDMWQAWVVEKFGGPQPIEISDETPRSERTKKIEKSRGPLRAVAEHLIDAHGLSALELHRLWSEHWQLQKTRWKTSLHWLRRFVLPRIGPRPRRSDIAARQEWKARIEAVRNVGGLSLQRLDTVRGLYRVLKAFRMRPEPDDLRRNIPMPGDVSLANFGRRILNQLERLREQRIKQLASRIVEAALGIGSEAPQHRTGRKRPKQRVADPRFAPCHAVVVENLEHYTPEESRLRRENRQIADWSARNVRKFIAEGCQLHGLHFVEVSPRYTSQQDSRTGAPGIRCEDVPANVLRAAVEMPGTATSLPDRQARRASALSREIRTACEKAASGEASARQRLLASLADHTRRFPNSSRNVLLPRRGGEIFVSADQRSPVAKGLQADLNAAANIGLRSLLDPDWEGAWWFVLVNAATGQADTSQVKGSAIWDGPNSQLTLLQRVDGNQNHAAQMATRRSGRTARRSSEKTYAWNPLFWNSASEDLPTAEWLFTRMYWSAVEEAVATHLRQRLTSEDTPW